jgi:predicted glycosyltransferase
VPAQCPDVFCADQRPAGVNEERDSFIEYLNNAEGQPPEVIAKVFGLTRQRVQQVLTARVCT